MDSRPRYSLTTGIPAVRVGWLIGQARRAALLDERALGKAVGVRKRTIRRWETAHQVPCDREIEAIANACHRNIADLLPPRDVVEFDAGARYLRVGGQSVSVADVHNDAVLTTYVALVREQRQLGEADKVTFRQPDLDVLSEALDLDDDSLETRLRRIAGLDENDAAEVRRRLVRRRLAMPAVGLLAGSWGLARLAAAEHAAPVDDHLTANASATFPIARTSAGPSVTVLDGATSTLITTTAPTAPTSAAAPVAGVSVTGVAPIAPTADVTAADVTTADAPVVEAVPVTTTTISRVSPNHPAARPRPTTTVANAVAPVIADAANVVNITPQPVTVQVPGQPAAVAPAPAAP